MGLSLYKENVFTGFHEDNIKHLSSFCHLFKICVSVKTSSQMHSHTERG